MFTKKSLIFSALFAFLCMCLYSCGSSTEKTTRVEEEKEDLVKINKEELDLQDGIPTVIDFYATWCVPCKQIEPVFAELSQQYKGKLNFMRVDVDKQPEIASEYNVKAMPTFVFLNSDDKEIERITGSYPEQLKAVVAKIAGLDSSDSQTSN